VAILTPGLDAGPATQVKPIRFYNPNFFCLHSQFLFRDIRAGNEDGAFRVVQDGSLRTAKKFNHKLRDKYILQIRVFDNGTPPLFSDTYGTKRRTFVHFFMLEDFVSLKV
jgi:hypothetical protein